MKKPLPLVVGLMLMFGCDERPYVKHSLAFKNTSQPCTSGLWNYKLVSNTNGERYEFSQCLPDTYNGKYTVLQIADTLRVLFTADTSAVAKTKFDLTLSVNAWPKYSHIYLGDQLLQLAPQ